MAPASRPARVLQVSVMVVTFAASLLIASYFGRLDVAAKPLLVAAGFLGSATALVILSRRLSRLSPHLAVLAVAAFMVVDLSVNNGPNESTGLPPAQYDVLLPNSTNPTLKFLQAKLKQPASTARRDRVELVGLGFEWPNVSLIQDFDHVFGYNPLRLAEINEVLGDADTLAEPRQRSFTKLFPSYRSVMADLLGLRYIACSVPIQQVDRRIQPGDLGLIARTGEAYIYENPRALPRALFVPDWRNADFEELRKSGDWPDFDPKQTVLLDREPDLARPSEDDLRLAAKSTVRIRRYENTVVEIDVDAATPGLVLLNDVWHPWWYASVDGRPTGILKANLLFRAVQVPSGKHVLHFEFRPFQGAIAEVENELFEGKQVTVKH
jgi:hypothetical protein